jgi:hypothetical protein
MSHSLFAASSSATARLEDMRDSMTGRIHPTLIDGTMPEKIEKIFIIITS